MQKEGQVRIPSGCAIAAVISKKADRIPGNIITEAYADRYSRKKLHNHREGLDKIHARFYRPFPYEVPPKRICPPRPSAE